MDKADHTEDVNVSTTPLDAIHVKSLHVTGSNK